MIRKFYISIFAAALLLALLLVAASSDSASGASAGNTVYVSTESELLFEVNVAQDGDVIVVTADITLHSMIYVANKHITIKGDGDVTITRGAVFNTSADANRGQYNPGMIEVATNVHDPTRTASLTLENITLDDVGPDPVRYPEPFPNDGGALANWKDHVYDSVISTYSPYVTVTLGDGVSIVNIGGASAVRMTGGVLNLEPGSYVEGSNASAGTFYGAIWLQGGATLNFNTTMDNRPITATYIHSDMATTVNFNGKITNCSISKPLYRNYVANGLGLHLSSSSKVNGNAFRNTSAFIVTGSNGTVKFDGEMNGNTFFNTFGANVIVIGGSNNAVEFNGKMNNNSNVGSASESCHLINVYGSNNTADLRGEINGNIFGASSAGSSILLATGSANLVTLHPGSVISGNTVGFATVRQFNTSSHFDIYGEVSNNTSVVDNGGGFYLSMGSATLYNGARVTGNTAYGSGGGFFLNQSSKLTIMGGVISGNTARCVRLADNVGGYAGGGGVALTASVGGTGSKLIMYGGTITGNSSGTIGGGVFLTGRSAGHTFVMEGGTITGNTCQASNPNGKDLAVGASLNNLTSSVSGGYHISIGPDAVISDASIAAALYNSLAYNKTGVYLTDRDDTVRIGNVATALQTTIGGRANAVPEYSSYAVRSAVWYSVERTSGTSELVMTYPLTNPNNYEWIAVIQPLGANAADLGGSLMTIVVPMRTDKGLKVTVPLIDSADGYAVVIMSVLKTVPMTLDLESYGNGDFYIDGSGGPEHQAVIVSGTISNFVITPAPGWVIGSVILTAGDGAVYDKTAAALSGTLTVSYSELAGGTNTIVATFHETLTLDLEVVGDGDFYIDGSGGPEYLVMLNFGETVSGFVIMPASGWRVGTVVLVAGDGTEYVKTADAAAGTLTVSYGELASGVNTITVTFLEIKIIDPDDDDDDDRTWCLLLLFLVLLALLIFLDDDDEEVCGKVTQNGKGVEGAKVSYTAKDGSRRSVTTDKDGDYSIPVRRGDDIVITEVTKGGLASSGVPVGLHIEKERTRVDFSL